LDTLNKKYATAITVGCRLNQTDTALIFDQLIKNGFEIIKPDENKELSVIIINTCTVTASASQKSRQYARSLKRKHPNALILVTGCDVDTEEDNWKKEPDIDILVANKNKDKIIEFILNKFKEKKISLPANDTTTENFKINNTGYYPFKSRANIKIQTGCDMYCTYCIVPYGRGKPTSREWDDTLDEFKQLVENGYKEIVLTGVNIATYSDNGKNLIDLLEKLVAIHGDFRIRLSSTEPQFQMNGLLDLMQSTSKICRFLHLPIQHAANQILTSMGRRYTVDTFTKFIHEAVEKIPKICIGSDFIIGFPGETDELFKEACNNVLNLPFAYLHIFPYSKRKGTPAAEYPNQVQSKIISERHKLLTKEVEKLSINFLNKQIETDVKVLVEEYSDGYFRGWSDNYINVNIKATPDKNLKNKFCNVHLTEIIDNRKVIGILK